MAGNDKIFAVDDTSVSKGADPPPIDTPHVQLALLAKRVDSGGYCKEQCFDSSFWAAMKKKYGVVYSDIIKDNNQLIKDPAITSSLSPAEKSTLAEINAQGSNVKKGQTVLFRSSTGAVGRTVGFYPEFEPTLNSEIYVVVDTLNLPGEKLIVRIMQGAAQVLAAPDSAIKVEYNKARTIELEIEVGAFYNDLAAKDTEGQIANKEDFKNLAIALVKLKDFRKADGSTQTDQDLIIDTEEGHTKLYLQVDAHTKHSKKIKKKLIRYRGGADMTASEWWKGDLDADGKENWIKLRAGWYDPVKSPQLLQFGCDGVERPASSTFGMVRTKPASEGGGSKPHQGVDIFAPIGTTLYACVDGKVVAVEDNVDGYKKDSYGNFVVIQLNHNEDLDLARHDDYDDPELPYQSKNETEHGPGFGNGSARFVMYGHMTDLSVKKGDDVWSGQEIGTSGRTGNAWKCKERNRHLHFEIQDELEPQGGLHDRTNPAFFINWVAPDTETQKNNTDSGLPT